MKTNQSMALAIAHELAIPKSKKSRTFYTQSYVQVLTLVDSTDASIITKLWSLLRNLPLK